MVGSASAIDVVSTRLVVRAGAARIRLVGSLFPGQPETGLPLWEKAYKNDLLNELAEYARKLNVATRLATYASAIRTVQTSVKDAHYFLLNLDPTSSQPRLSVTGFTREEAAEAQMAYVEAERGVKEKPGTDAVLVSVDSIESLSQAYPNYYADTSVFLDLLGRILARQPRRF